MIKGFHHAAISTPDLDRCLDFYTNIIGGEVVDKFGWDAGQPLADKITGVENSAAKVAVVKVGETFLEVFEFTSPDQEQRTGPRPVHLHGITHICLEVTDMESEFQRLSAAGVAFNTEPNKQDDRSMVYGRDPDGNVIELLEFLHDE